MDVVHFLYAVVNILNCGQSWPHVGYVQEILFIRGVVLLPLYLLMAACPAVHVLRSTCFPSSNKREEEIFLNRYCRRSGVTGNKE
jgi:hypothetical protein